jgi:hypothetical protein
MTEPIKELPHKQTELQIGADVAAVAPGIQSCILRAGSLVARMEDELRAEILRS